MGNDLKPARTHTPVLLIFFNRPATFQAVFDAVKAARPEKLFLACDGPRSDHPQDAEYIQQCKTIVEDIDWACEVHTNYATENLGCGMRPQTAILWAFEFVDRLVVLEDDCVPHKSFFPYMEDLLERYKDDERIGLICGFNHFLNWDCGNDSYFYTKVGPMGGAWGSWKRVWEQYDYSLNDVNDPRIQKLLQNDITFKRAKKKKVSNFVETAAKLREHVNLSYWDVQFGYLKYAQSMLSIVPRVSLASNIGLGADSTHAQNAKNTMPSIFFAAERPFSFPMQHPRVIICDHAYDDKVDSLWGYPNPIRKNFQRGIRLLKRLLHIKG